LISSLRATAGGKRVHHVMTEHPGGEAAIIARQEGRQDLHAMSAAAVEAHQPGVLRLDQDSPDMRPAFKRYCAYRKWPSRTFSVARYSWAKMIRPQCKVGS
jgi:hypothetical protein